MNKVYRIIWSRVKEAWVVVSEKVTIGNCCPATSVGAVALAGLLGVGGSAFALDPGALPTGGAITAGSGSIATSGSRMTINQSSQQMIANWSTFNIGANAGVRFNQPNAAATALNRITDQNPSQILGSLSANGRVFLLNPAGIVFGQNARVDVGGLVASSLNMLDSDFLAGKHRFNSPGAAGAVVNQGNITANGGVVALIAPKVTNEGTITADKGSVLLAAANQVSLDFNGDGLISYTVDRGAVDALAENKGLVRADGGLVVMTAKAADSLSRAVVNNSGVVEARTLESKDGRILLLSDMERGAVQVGGTLDASAPGGGNGGFIETSAAQVRIAEDARVTTQAASGNSGTWLIDPTNFTISSGTGAQTTSGIGATTLASNLGSGNVVIATAAAGSEAGDINVNADVTWTTNKLTLEARGDININANLKANTNASLDMKAGYSTPGTGGGSYDATKSVLVGMNADGTFKGKVSFYTDAGTTGRSGTGFLTINGNGYTVITALGSSPTDSTAGRLSAIGTTGYYALGADIDATATGVPAYNATWRYTPFSSTYGYGFRPVGSSTSTAFSGVFNGLGHTIDKLYIYHPYSTYYNYTPPTGLFSALNGGTISNVGLTNMEVANYGAVDVGGLVGRVSSGTVSNSYVTTATGKTIGGGSNVGGLVGTLIGSNSVIDTSWTNADVYGNTAGGLVGSITSSASVTDSYAKGAITGGATLGGLAGSVSSATISNSYASGVVGSANSTSTVGGLVGSVTGATISDSYYSGTTIAGYLYLGGLFGSYDLASVISNSYYNASTVSIKGATGVVTLGGLYDTQYTAWQTGGRAALLPGTYFSTVDTDFYALNTVADLQNALAFVYTDGIKYKLTADLDLTTISGWNLARLKGTFNGDGHTLSNVAISQNFNKDVGLFGKLDGVTVTNLTLSGVTVSGYGNTGGLAGSGNNNSGISGVTITGAAITGSSDGNIGGLVGYNTSGSTIANSSAAGTLTGNGANSGGLVGLNDSSAATSISGSSSSINLTVTADRVGGLVGKNSGAKIDDSSASGSVTATSYSDVGGLVGQNTTSALITNSHATGAASGYSNVGGLVGLHAGNSSISNSYADGAVTGTSDVGGLVGESNASTITGSHAKTGTVTGNSNGSNIGGLIGQAVSTTLSNSYSSKNVSASSAHQVGGLVGFATSTTGISNSYATGTVAGGFDVGGLAGVLRSGSTITGGSYYAGTTITGTRNVGGLVGNDYLANANDYTQNSVLHDTSTRVSNSFYNADAVSINGGKQITLGAMYNKQYTDWFAPGGNNRSALDISSDARFTDLGGSVYGVNASNIEFLLGYAYHDGIKFKLTENIDLSALSHSDGTSGNLFQWHLPQLGRIGADGSSFDGGGFALSNLNVTQTFNNDIGLFGRLVNAEVKNLNLNTSSAGTVTVGGYANVGGLVGYNHKGTISGINAYSVTATGGSGFSTTGVTGYSVGGLVGYSKAGSTISAINSEADRLTGTISSNGRYVGGLVGYNEQTTITNAHTNVTLAGTGTQDYGGLVGRNVTTSNISNSSTTGAAFNASGKSSVGGLVGYNDGNSDISGSYSTLTITGTGSYAGGLVGYNSTNSDISASYATGAISGSSYVGGLVGYNSSTSLITNSYTGSWAGPVYTVGGSVTGSGSYIGGLLGYNATGSTVSGSYAAATVQGGSYVGGLVGQNYDATISGSYTGYSDGNGGYTAGNGVSGSSYVGGLVGYDWNTALGTYKISASFATGAVTGTGQYAGGLVGFGTKSKIENSYATGDVTGVNQVGGLIGQSAEANISGSYAESGKVDGSRDVGGLVGGKYDPLLTVSNSYYNVDATLINNARHMTLGGIYNKQFADWRTGNQAALTASDYFGAADGSGYYSLNTANIEFAPAFIYTSAIKFKLAENVDLAAIAHSDAATSGDTTKLAEWSLKEFRGAFDGNGKTLSNLTISQAFNGDLGLVGRLIGGGALASQATVTNLSLDNAAVTGYYNIGSLVGYNRNSSVSTITGTNVTVTGDSSATYGTSGMGGLIGYSEDTAIAPTVTGYTIQNSSVTGTLSGQGNNLGGLVGYNDSMAISGSSANVAVTAGTTTSTYVGGLVGYNFTANVGTSSATGAVSAAGKTYVGGLIGYNTGSNTTGALISNSFATGAVSGATYVGGLIGQNQTYSTVNGSYATGNVNAGSGSYVGGLIGYNGSYSNIGASSASYATGSVTGGSTVGGLVGYNNQATVTNSYTGVKTGGVITTAAGTVTGTSYVGGLIGQNNTGNVASSTASGAVAATSDYVGGLVGSNSSSTISSGSATGNVSAAGSSNVGGLIGYNYSGAISGTTSASGTVTGGNNTGGLVGYNTTGSTVTGATATGNVTGAGYVGGLIGQNWSNSAISSSSSSGEVTATGTSVGGLVGYTISNITGSFSTSKVTAGASDNVGGLVGYNSAATISGSYHTTGAVSGRDYVGGLVGYTTGTGTAAAIQNGSYAAGDVTGRNYVGGLAGYSYQNSTISGSYYTGGTVLGTHNVGGLVGVSDLTNASYVAAVTNSYYSVDATLLGTSGETATHAVTLGGLYSKQFSDWLGSSRTMASADTYFGTAVSGYYQVDAKNIEYLLGYSQAASQFKLKESIDLSTLKHWNGSAFTTSLGEFRLAEFRGTLDGGGYQFSNLQVNQAYNDEVGFIGRMVGGTLNKVVISGTSAVNGWDNVGGLVGYAKGSTITSSGVAVSVTGKGSVSGLGSTTGVGVGGLVGKKQDGTISTSFSLGAVTGENVIGGLVGYNYHASATTSITDSYASGTVTGSAGSGNYIGGLVGYNANGNLTRTYASGKVARADGISTGYTSAGGLTGAASGGTITASYFNSSTGGLGTSSSSGTAKTLAELQAKATFSGWSIRSTGTSTGETWRVYEGNATPLLTGFLTAVSGTVSNTPISRTYDGTNSASVQITWSGSPVMGLIQGDSKVYTSSKNAGTYLSAGNTLGGVWSSQLGYDITLAGSAPDVTIAKANLTISGAGATNKVYDATTAATVTGGTVSAIAGDAVTLSAANATFANKNVGTGKAITTAYTLSGADAGNYTLVQPTGLTADISKANLTISGLTVQNKVYDGTTATTLSGTATVNVLGSDQVTMSGTAVVTFVDKNAGTGKAVTVNGLTISGTDAGNYTLVQPAGLTADITKANLAVSGLSAQNKIYDATTTATLTGTAAISPLGSDQVTLGGTAAGVFADKNAGTAKAVTVSGLTISGTDAGNYILVQPTGLTADISKANLTISGITAQNKVYDTTATATLSGTAAISPLGSDQVTLSGTAAAAFADKNAGTGKMVTVSGLTISGTDAGNYTLIQPAGLTADITKANLAVSGLTTQSKVYDATTTATLNGTAAISPLGSDQVTLSGTAVGAFADKNVGTGKAVTVSGLTIGGTDAGNYTLVQQTGLTADITKANLTVSSAVAANKVYDATTAATVTGGMVTALAGDVVVLSAANATFADKNVGASKAITTAYVLSGTDAGNYTVVQPTGLAANITKATLVVSGLAAQSKTYDGSTAASLAGTATVTPLGTDQVALSGAASGAFGDKNVGSGKTVTVSGLALSGADAGNYTLSQPGSLSADISRASLAVTGAVAANKVYDATTKATVTGGTVTVFAGDAVALSAANATFGDKNVGTGKTVTTAYTISGTDAGNYILVQPTGLTADISRASLIVSGAVAVSKVYDATTAATVTSGAVTAFAGDQVVLSAANAAFADKNAGTGKSVTTAYTLSGADAGNYTLTQPSGLTADITRANLAVSGLAAQNKVYDGATTAVLGGTAAVNALGGDQVSLNGTAVGAFADQNVGAGKAVTVSGLTLGGTDAGNYTLTLPVGLTASITRANLAVTALDDTRAYSGAAYSGGNGVSYQGFVNGEGSSVLSGSLTYGGTSQGAVNAGSYTIIPGGLTSGNYAIQYNGGSLTITGASTAPTQPQPTPPQTDSSSNQSTPPQPVQPQPLPPVAQPVSTVVLTVPQQPVVTLSPSAGTAVIGTTTPAAGAITASAGSGISGAGGTVAGSSPVSVAGSGGAAGTVGAAAADVRGVRTLETTASGITVQLVNQPSAQQNGVIVVSVPGTLVASGSGFSFPLPQQLLQNAHTGTAGVTVSLTDGGPLPGWLQYNQDSKSFVATNVPAGGLPLRVAIAVGGQTYTVDIAKN